MIHQLESQDWSRMIKEQTVEFIDSQDIDQKIEETMKEAVTASVQYEMRAPLHARFKDLPTSDMKEILLQRMLEENYDKDKAEKLKKKKSKQDSQKISPGSPPPPPPPPPPSGASGASSTTGAFDSTQDPPPLPPSPITHQDDQSQGSAALDSSKIAATTTYTTWIMTTSRFEPSASSIPEDVFMHEESDFAAQDMVLDDEDIGSRYIPKVTLNQEWFKPLSEEERLATPKPTWFIPSSSLPVPTHNWASTIASSYVPPSENSLLLPIGDIGVFIDWFYKKQGITKLTLKHLEGPAYEVVKAFHLDGDRLALLITKMKAAYYPDVRLEQMVPDQMWIEEECMYDIFATYVLRRAYNQKYTIAENDFKDLYPSDFKDLYLLNLQGHLNHLPPRDKKILSSAINLWIRNLVIRQRMIMRFNEIHKFSDGTLQQIDEALDYQVKEFRVNKVNPGLNTRFWITNDVIKSKQFMFAIQNRLKLRRIFRNLESFVGGRI
ncbi:hypothetical protein Tco_0701717 [Tanacetum coccineum]